MTTADVTPRTALLPELMDDPELPLEATERALLDIERLHRWFGNRGLWRLLFGALEAGQHPGSDGMPQRLLDIGAGNGAVATQAAQRAAQRGIAVIVIGLDRKLSHLTLGRGQGHSQLRVVGDALALPFADGSVEVGYSTLFQHHFPPAEGAKVLAEMSRVSRRAAVVVDIRRSRIGSLLGRLALAVLGVGPVASYDGRLSLDQGWSLTDVRRAAPEGAIRSLGHCWPFRWALELAPGRGVTARARSRGKG